TIQHALARGIEAVFQLEQGEILVEPTPDTENRNALLFYEAAEGGAGALAQLPGHTGKLARVAAMALEIMHYDRNSFDAARTDPARLAERGKPDCVAGCYRCVLSYFNQTDHEHIDRRDGHALAFLLRLEAFSGNPAAMDTASPRSGTGAECTVPPDDAPYELDGMHFEKIWRRARLIVIDEGAIGQDLHAGLVARGIRVLERPNDPADLADFEAERNRVLEDAYR
ncbi:MAG: DUF1998 domain-containing protein, partial [Rhodospirillales bacterium]|nr:DUF1998 domain-containing protein [Rhodospirillales bacterium]